MTGYVTPLQRSQRPKLHSNPQTFRTGQHQWWIVAIAPNPPYGFSCSISLRSQSEVAGRASAIHEATGAGRDMLPRPKRLKTSGTLRWSLNIATGYIPRRAFVVVVIVGHVRFFRLITRRNTEFVGWCGTIAVNHRISFARRLEPLFHGVLIVQI